MHPVKLFCLLLLLCTCTPGLRLYAQDTTAEQELPATEAYDEAAENEAYAEEYASDEEETYTEEYAPDIAENTPAPAQRSRGIGAAQWDKLATGQAFQYEDPPPPSPPKQDNSVWAKILGSILLFFTSGLGNILIIAVVALIAVVIIVRVFQLKGNILFARRDSKLHAAAVDETSDLFIPDNWEKAIQDAAATGNYRLAVRHGYRYLLHLLQEKKIINFQAAKTNYQYVYDLSETRLHKPFLQLTRNYEYAWYGGFPITKEELEAYLGAINNIKRDLN